jgi:Subtilisin-like serine proteases
LKNSIVVAAIDREGKMYATSNYGKCVDVAAPGENIVGLYGKDGFIKSNGTSAAAPFVTGVCSLLLETKKDLKPSELKKIITNNGNVTPVKGLEKSVKSGGIINAYKAYRFLMMNY